MRVTTERTVGVPASTMAALMLAVFTVSDGFGVMLPLLPYLIERLLGAGVEAARVPRPLARMLRWCWCWCWC